MDVITMLRIIRQNLDEIPVTGISHQSRMVGCAEMLDNAIHDLQEEQKAKELQKSITIDFNETANTDNPEVNNG